MVIRTIAIKEDTKDMLNDLGSVSDSFDDVIKRLIKSYNSCTCVTSHESESKSEDGVSKLIEEHKKKEGWE